MNARNSLVCVENGEDLFHIRFARYKRLLLELARRLVREDADAQIAVRNCRRAALSGLREFSSEGAFRSWLFRILIDQGVLIVEARRQKQPELDPLAGAILYQNL